VLKAEFKLFDFMLSIVIKTQPVSC